MSSRSSGVVRRIVISLWRTTHSASSAGNRVRLAVRCRAAEAVAVVGDPPVYDVLYESDTGNAIEPQRHPRPQRDRPRRRPRLGAGVDGSRRVQPAHGFQQPVTGNAKTLRHSRALQWLGLEIARLVVCNQKIDRPRAHPARPVEEQNTGHTFIVHCGVRSVTACFADMTDVILSTVSPAYSAVRSTLESGIPI